MSKIDAKNLKATIPIEQYYRDELGEPEKSHHDHWVYFCPFHDDEITPNLCVYHDGGFKCFACNAVGDVLAFHQKKNNLSFHETLKDLAQKYAPSLIKEDRPNQFIAEYDYRNQDGELQFQVVRTDPKGFLQRVPDKDGGYKWGLNGTKPILYRLKEIMENEGTIYIVEGEKDADLLSKHGLNSTTCPGGAGKWRDEFNQFLNERDVVIVPDNDDPGRKHAEKISNSLQGKAKSIKVITPPNLEKGGDVSDYLRDHSIDELVHLVDQAKPQPTSLLNSLETWEHIQSLDIKVEWIVDRLIPKESINILFGKGGVGKTWLTMDIARSIGSGIDFLGYETNQAPVIFIDFENPLAVLNTRTKKLGEAENVYFWRANGEIKAPNLDSPEWILYKELPEGAVLIFDTLRASHSKDENASDQIGTIMGKLKELRDMGFTIILLHHTAKNSDKMAKGSTAIVDLADHILGLTKVRQAKDGQDTVIDDDESDEDPVYRFGTRQKTRFEPHQIYLTLNPERGFELAPDPEEEKLKEMHRILVESGPQTKTAFAGDCKKVGLGLKKAKKLIDHGSGRYWKTQQTGQKNSIMVTAIQFGSSAPLYRKAQLPNRNEPKQTARETIKA